MSEAKLESSDCSPFEDVERILGRRVDRRKRYKVIDGEPCELASWTQSCFGCYETIDGHPFPGTTYDKNGIALGGGCEECGYHGKVRVSMWLPIIEENGEMSDERSETRSDDLLRKEGENND